MNIRVILAASAIALAAAGTASAASVTFGNGEAFASNGGTMAINPTKSAPGMAQVSFAWSNFPSNDATPAYAYLDFRTTGITNITLEDYQPDFNPISSGFTILNRSTNTFVTDNGTCTTNGSISILDGYLCNRVTGTDGKPGTSQAPIDFFGLAAGEYRIAVFEPNNPGVGNIDFDISAVPLPAGGLLLVGGLGALGALRRREA